jgi:hypothetical protein
MNYQWQYKKARAEQLHREYLGRLQRHIDPHFVQAPKILTICARYVADAEKLMKPADNLSAPRILVRLVSVPSKPQRVSVSERRMLTSSDPCS